MQSLIRNNEAMTEFDKIPPALMSLAYFKAGLPASTMQFLSKDLLRHKYYPVTTHGESISPNEYLEEDPLFGPGQGSLDDTNAWGLVHDKIDKVYSNRTQGAIFKSITDELTWQARIGAFADDVTLYHMNHPTMMVPEVEKMTSQDLQYWVDLL